MTALIDELVDAGRKQIDASAHRPLMYTFDQAWVTFMVKVRDVPEDEAKQAYFKLMEEFCPNRIEITGYVSRQKVIDFANEHSRGNCIIGLFVKPKSSYVFFSDLVDATYFRLMH
jgi:hypothetical protein